METRRNFLHKAGLSAVALVTMPSLLRASSEKSTLKKFGLFQVLLGKNSKPTGRALSAKQPNMDFQKLKLENILVILRLNFWHSANPLEFNLWLEELPLPKTRMTYTGFAPASA
jgi:hypothetical protein